jgi:hypothetical protein
VYAFLTKQGEWPRGKRKSFILKSLKATAATQISVLGHDGKILEYSPNADASPKFRQQSDGLHLDIMRAQRIYNNSLWPNPVVVKLTAMELVPDNPTPISPPSGLAPMAISGASRRKQSPSSGSMMPRPVRFPAKFTQPTPPPMLRVPDGSKANWSHSMPAWKPGRKSQSCARFLPIRRGSRWPSSRRNFG